MTTPGQTTGEYMLRPAIATRPGAPAPEACDSGAHDILIGMTVPLMGGSWQRDRIVIGDALPPAMAASIARGGKIAIALTHGARPCLALTGPNRIALAYDPAALPAARAALIAASAQGGWPVAGDPQSLALLSSRC